MLNRSWQSILPKDQLHKASEDTLNYQHKKWKSRLKRLKRVEPR